MSVEGRSVTVSATTAVRHRVFQHCAGNYDCCPRSGLEWLGTRTLDPTLQTVSFAAGASADGGAGIPLDGSIDVVGP